MSSSNFTLDDNRVAERPPKPTSRLSMHMLTDYLSFNLFINSSQSSDGQKFSSKTSKLSSVYHILRKNYFLFLLLVFILFIPTINCEHNSSHNHNNVIKSKDAINYVDDKSSEEVSHRLIETFN